ncbi:MAG: HAD-IC family P-type ATPase [Bacteriovorax sp.]|jgi:Ca2+-transporting ATPase
MDSQLSWHSLQNEEVVRKLNSHTTKGLSQKDAVERLTRFGTNTLPEPKKRTLISIFLHQFLSPLIYLLLAAAGIAFFIGDVKDAVVIIIVVLLNAVVGSIQEGRAEQSLRSLRSLSKLMARVLREGNELEIEAANIVPGDMILLNSGDAVPADARLIESSSLSVSEASLTGESLPVAKNIVSLSEITQLADRLNMVYAGTHITFGRAKAIVVSTGLSNEIGKIAKLTTNTEQPKTQLEQRIRQFGNYLVVAAIVLFFLVIGIGSFQGISFAQIFMIAISQMVSMVPEGLPVAMTVALAVGVQRMARKNTIVRRLSAVETLGSITVICSDKTGTLTRNEMVVTTVYLPEGKRRIIITGTGYTPEGQFIENEKILVPNEEESLQQLFLSCILCNDAQLLEPENGKNWRVLGDPTEGALLTFAAKGGLDPLTVRNNYPRKAELPFNSDIKMMATQHKSPDKNIVFIKGAPESVLALCECDENTRLEIQQEAQRMADSTLRVLAFGFINDAYIDGSRGFDPFIKKITFLGLIGELDPPRDEVAIAVGNCQVAGIKPVMVTGDHKATGLAIAKSLGISQNNDLALDGSEIDHLSDKELAEKIDMVTVFARVHPAQKLRIVEAFQKKGEIVAMTGDGVNDAPALMRADVGVAMGITGTEVAKEAAKIVIADDNFATIVSAISEGRLIYQNIKKLILFLFVTSIDELFVLFLALIMGFPPPLAAVQILWINLITEGALTINLIMEPPEGDEMKHPPISTKEPLLDRALLSRIPLLVLTSVASTFGWFVYRTATGVSPILVQSETFTMLAVCQWFNVLNCRSAIHSAFSLDLLKNSWLLGGLILGNALQFAVIYWPPLSQFFHTVPIDFEHLLKIGVMASFVLWAEELRKLLARKKLNRKHEAPTQGT